MLPCSTSFDHVVINFLSVECAPALGDCSLGAVIQCFECFVASKDPEHENDGIDGNHSIESHQSIEPFVGKISKTSAQPEERCTLDAISYCPDQHRASENAEECDEGIREKVRLLSLSHHSHTQCDTPDDQNKSSHSHSVGDKELR